MSLPLTYRMSISKEERKVKYQGLALDKQLLNKVKEHVKDDWRFHGNVTAFVRASIIEKLEGEEAIDIKNKTLETELERYKEYLKNLS